MSQVGMEAIKLQQKSLSLNEEELLSLDIDKGPLKIDSGKSRRSLLGKLCSTRIIGNGIIQATMEKIWKLSKLAFFKEKLESLHHHFRF